MLVLILVVIGITAASALHGVPEYQRLVVFRLGRPVGGEVLPPFVKMRLKRIILDVERTDAPYPVS